MDTIAINYDEIPNMQTAIKTYSEELRNQVTTIGSNSIKGVYGTGQVATVNKYIENTCNEINNIIYEFDSFADKLNHVKAAYELHEQGIKTSDVLTHKTVDADSLVTVNKLD